MVYFYPNDAVNPFQQQVKSPATNTVDARISITEVPLGRNLLADFAVLGENLLDENQVVYGIDFGGLGFGGAIFAEPRRFAIEIKLSF